MKLYEQTRTQAGAILGNLQGLVAAREAQAAIVADSEPLRKAPGRPAGASCRRRPASARSALVAAGHPALFAIALRRRPRLYVQLQDAQAPALAEQQRLEAERRSRKPSA